MRTLQQLSVRGSETDTSTTQISEFQGEQWERSVVQYAENTRVLDQAAIVRTYPDGVDTLHIGKTTAVLSIDLSPSGGEADVRDYTELTNLDTVAMTLASGDWKRGAIAISKQIAKTSMVDLLKQARYAIGQGLAEDVDDSLATTLQDTGISNVVYGGDATGVDSLESGDIFTPDVFADAKDSIEANGWIAKHVFIHSKMKNKHLLKDPQFTNAAEYGGDSVIKTGEIGDYVGVKIYVTNNCPSYAGSATDTNETPTTWGVAGKVGIMIGESKDGERVAYCLAWKEKPTIDYEFRKDRAIHVIYADQCYDTAIIQASAICLIKVANS